MKDPRGATKDHSPRRILAGDHPQRILPGAERLAFDEDIATESDPGRRVGARVPDRVPGNERAEELASPGDGSAVGDGDLGESDVLRHRSSLTWRIALRFRSR